MTNCRRLVALLASCAGLASAAPVIAQPLPAPSASPLPGTPPSTADADLSLDADVHIRSIRFDVVPNAAHITVTGVNQTGGSRVVRTNLPSPPQAGKTYTNVRVQVHAASRFVDPHGSAAPSPRPTPR